MGMTALLGLVAACTDPISVSPTFDPETNQVLTQFIINIAPADKNVNTKQSSESVQVDGTPFRGLGNASLFTFDLGTDKDGSRITNPLTDDAQKRPTGYFDLSKALEAGSLDPSGGTSDDPKDKSRRILEINLKTGTNAILFYGEGILGDDADTKNDYGQLLYTMEPEDMTSIGCRAKPRLMEFKLDDSGHETTVETDEAVAYHKTEQIIENCYNWMFKIGINGNGGDTSPLIDRNTTVTGSDAVIGVYNILGVPIHWKDYAQCDSREANVNHYSPLGKLINDQHKAETATGYEDGYTPLPENEDCAALEEMLGRAYNSFIRTDRGGATVKEFRAGSGASVARQMYDLFVIIDDAMEYTPTNDKEIVAKLIVEEIYRYVSAIFDTTPAFKWKGASAIISGLTTRVGSNFIKLTPPGGIYTVADFPMQFDLPIGSTTMRTWTQADKDKYGTSGSVYENLEVGNFYYLSHLIDISGMAPSTAVDPVMTVHDYTYPPSLVYYGNSSLRISEDNDLRNTDFLDGANTWENGTWNSKWKGIGHVTASTRGVAVVDNIQYGNAMLGVQIKYASDVVGGLGLADNNQEINGSSEDPNIFYPGTGAGKNGNLKLTGVMVGGQPSKVGWNYLPASGASFDKMVYDKRINSATGGIDKKTNISTYALVVPADGDTTRTNYTLLFDNYQTNNGTPAQAQSVYVALEFVNDLDDDFWGNANMVRKGGTFYLLGELKMTDSMKENFDWSQASKIMPPYDASGSTLTGENYVRIFMQDFLTRATFTITKDSLKHAYVTVPDLRSSKMSLGLSVDLEWSKGLVFDDIEL